MFDNNVQTVGPDEYPLYEADPVVPEEEEVVPEGKINSDSVSGIKAVTAVVAGPNVLVATDETGKLPTSVLPSRGVLQVVNTSTGALVSGSTAIPYDDSIPQSGEGTEAFTLTITPTSASSKLKIEVVCVVAGSSTNRMVVALFKDSTADALATEVSVSGGTDNEITIPMIHYMTAGTTSATTFKVRFGTSSGNYYLNGQSGARKYGGSLVSSLTITELA